MAKVVNLDMVRKTAPACRLAVDEAMQEMIEKLCSYGLDRRAIALTLADAAEDYVIALASGKMSTH
ncbi:MAG TPA: hypothetical protein VGC14_24260 [Rhizobium sp.]